MQNESKRRLLKSGMAFSLVCFILFTPIVSLGWGPGGHMMVAQIAYDRLNPNAKTHANALLALLIDPADITKNSPDFVNAAHWPDDLRPVTAFKWSLELHFIDTPFSLDGTKFPPLSTSNIVSALQDNVNILKTSTDQNAQAQALRFIIHFVGDIHQPLHCTSRFSKALPDGDRGGNLVSINIPGKNGAVKKTNLHSYWDGGLGTFPPAGPNFRPPPLSQIPAAAALAKKGNPDTDPALKLSPPFNFQTWAHESFALAKDVAYPGIKNGGTPTASYKSKGTKAARQRIAWGGYRLAALLNAIWP